MNHILRFSNIVNFLLNQNAIICAINGAVTIEFHIDNLHNNSADDISSLTEEVLETANAYITRK